MSLKVEIKHMFEYIWQVLVLDFKKSQFAIKARVSLVVKNIGIGQNRKYNMVHCEKNHF